MNKRLFLAINLPHQSIANLNRELSLIRTSLGEKNIRWTKSENIHFTLAFLGDTPEEKLQIIKDKLQIIANEYNPFWIRLRGLGVFPDINRPRILWIGSQAETLEKIGHLLQTELKRAGFRIDDHKPFKAHLTIARIKFSDQKFKEKLSALREKYKEKEFGQFQAKSIEMMESTLSPAGPIYKVLISSNFVNRTCK